MKRQPVQVTILVAVVLLIGCTSPPTRDGVVSPDANLMTLSPTISWDGVVLPESTQWAVSPRLNWVIYEHNGDLWLAPLPSLENPSRIVEPRDPSVLWLIGGWMPDETGFLMASLDRMEGTETLWLVKTNDLGAQLSLCTLPARERAGIWSPAGNAFMTVDRGGRVMIVHADGSGCEELPIPGVVMMTVTVYWSPDGQKIAYIYIPRGGLEEAELHCIDLNTYQKTIIYDDTGYVEWFPDGELIALMGWGDAIPIIRADGSGLVKEIKLPGGYWDMPNEGVSWSPDSSRLALYLEVEGPDYEPVAIGILDRNTLELSVFEVPYFSEIVGWTPDGSAVVVLSYDDEGRGVLREEKVIP